MEAVEERSLAKNPEDDPNLAIEVVMFSVKYLGSTVVTNNHTPSDAVTTILSMAKATKRKKNKVNVTISLSGIMVTEKSGSLILDASVYRISNCATDPLRRNIFAFFETNRNDITQCHAFLCDNSKVAQSATLRIAHLFRTAFEVWHRGHQLTQQEKQNSEKLKADIKSAPLIDFTPEIKPNNWVTFETEDREILINKPNQPPFLSIGRPLLYSAPKRGNNTVFSDTSSSPWS